MVYLPRVVDQELDELFCSAGGVAAVALEGPKAVGKTETALRRAKTTFHLDDPGAVEILRADPQRLIRGDRPILVDEWQRFPSSWDVVRRAVDQNRAGGQFLLTGSAAPIEQPTHSGAGRIVTLRMRPLSVAERGLVIPTVSIARLLQGGRPPVDGSSRIGLDQYVEEIVASGFPAIRQLSARARRLELDAYIERITERDFEEMGRKVRNEGALRRWMAAYAAATSTAASYEVIRDAATPGEGDKANKITLMGYRRVLEQLWIIDQVPAWLPTRNHLSRLGSAPRHHLADPALAARLLGVDAAALIANARVGPTIPRDGTFLGALFESLAVLSVRVYAQPAGARVGHLRTHSGDHEVDIVVENDDGRIIAIEVKLVEVPDNRDLQHLRWLSEKLGPDLLDAVVITTGPEAYRREDGIAVVPLALLGP